MSDKTTRRGIYLTNLQWANAKAAGDGYYSAGVRMCLDDREDFAKRNDHLAARLADKINQRKKVEALEAAKIESDATIERYIEANGELVLQVENLTEDRADLQKDAALNKGLRGRVESLQQQRKQAKVERNQARNERDEASARLACRVYEVQELRGAPTPFPRFALGFLAACMMGAAALAVLEGIDKAWWGWTL